MWKSGRSGHLLLFLYLCFIAGFFQFKAVGEDAQEVESSVSLFEKSETVIGRDFQNPYQLAYNLIIPETDKIWIDDRLLIRDTDYTIDYKAGEIVIKPSVDPDSIIKVDYHIIPIAVKRVYQRQLFAPQIPQAVTDEEKEVTDEQKPEAEKVIGVAIPEQYPSTLSFSGTKTVSVSMESDRGLTVNQPTRLNVSGNVSENVSVMALLSDQDLPLQPEGTTEEIEDLDRILIKIQGKNLSATLGSYETAFDETEFVLSPKMLDGATAQGEFDTGGFKLIGAVSRGKSSSITLSGVEGQNEYRISVDGQYIVMIAGSETVWLNGEKMRRGEEQDYVIRDYGGPIIEFTNKHLITGNDVILVDFEYIEEDRNYRQNLYGTRGKVNLNPFHRNAGIFGEMLTLGVSYATESDDKDNPIMPLNEAEILSLKRNDLDPDGDGVLLPAPAKRSVIGFDSSLNISDNTYVNGEVAFSKHDENTFSGVDIPEDGRAWKMNGASTTDKLRISFDMRQLDSNFIPIGATLYSRNRSLYQKNYDDVAFGEMPTSAQKSPSGEASYSMDLWYEPTKSVQVAGNLGRVSDDYIGLSDISKRTVDHWGRSFKIAFPELPQVSTRYQEAITDADGTEEQRKTREIWELDHELMQKIDVRITSEEIQTLTTNTDKEVDDFYNKDRKRQERRVSIELPAFKKMSLSGEYSLETEYFMTDDNIPQPEHWAKSLSAHTASLNFFAKPSSWVDFSGYFARRTLERTKESFTSFDSQPSDMTTNVADLKLNLKNLRINYQIDRKLSTEKEEQYVNYIITVVDGKEEKRFLKPGEGSYVKIDEYTYREDMEKGEYIRLIRTVNDRPVASVALQSVFQLRPRSSIRSRDESPVEYSASAFLRQILSSVSMFEVGARIREEQEDVSSGFYFLSDLQTDRTIYGIRRYWYRTQISPIKRLSLMTNWETGSTINKRINNRARELESDTWNVKIESPLTRSFSLGGEWEEDNSQEKVSNLFTSESVSGVVSDISQRQKSRSLFLRYTPISVLSRLELKTAYDTEYDDDALSDEPPVLTKKLSVGSEATWSFRGRGTAVLKYEIAKGISSGELPFARYDFHEGISHTIRLETSYRFQWVTDLITRLIYRTEITEQRKPDHRLEMEATASF